MSSLKSHLQSALISVLIASAVIYMITDKSTCRYEEEC